MYDYIEKPSRPTDKIPNPFKDYKPPKIAKRLKTMGKRSDTYNRWRDQIAIPYLDRTYGHYCFKCGCGGKLDVAHIIGRGRDASLRMALENVKYLCRPCHVEEDSGFRYKDPS